MEPKKEKKEQKLPKGAEKLKAVSRPNNDSHNAILERIDKEYNAIKDKLYAENQKHIDKFRQRSGKQRAIAEIQKDLADTDATYKKLQAEVQKLQSDLSIKEKQYQAESNSFTQYRAKLPCQSEDEVADLIKKKTYYLEHNTLTRPEERQITGEIQRLKQSRGQFAELETKRTAMRNAETEMKKAKRIADDKKYALEHFNETVEKDRKKMERLQQELVDMDKDEDMTEVKKLEAQLAEKNTEYNQARDNHQQQWKEYKAYNEEIRKLRDIEWQETLERRKREKEEYKQRIEAEKQQRKQEAEERERLREERLAQFHPWQDEMENCDLLVTHLVQLTGGAESAAPVEEVAAAPTTITFEDESGGKGKKGKGSGGADFGEFTLIQKKKEPEPEPRGKKGKRDRKAKASTHVLSFPIAILGGFSKIGVTCPTSYDQLAAKIEEVKQRKEYFRELPPPPKPEKKAEETPAVATEEKKPDAVEEKALGEE
ncbi:hypothetical protein BLNAU_15055 [Blattamonas nauphoetae]|uniref:Uncharacterized protein n=1 Tax=Blattamonas nauphoetae TaxID=2049346 RepID=A0ABQ9XIL0_9EUKA|nr:hypothetical protein BLNAU_15055 [Blattamonas nauphoetae]